MKKWLTTALLLLACGGVHAARIDSLRWVDARTLRITGQAFDAVEAPYDRLPALLRDSCREELWTLATHSSGIAVRFRTNSPTLAAEWTLRYDTHMEHMTGVGIRGLDLYRLVDGRWCFAGIGRPLRGKEQRRILQQEMVPEMAEYLLYLPTYDGVDKVLVGVEPDAVIETSALPTPRRHEQIVFYGTSITQGGCANRAGMCYPSIIGRDLDCETFNFGFSGNGRLDLCIARQLARLDPTVYVLDCFPNCTAAMIEERLVAFIRILREAHPTTPILVADNYRYATSQFNAREARELDEKSLTVRHELARLTTDEHLHFIPAIVIADNLGSVDGVHLTDLGFMAMARYYEEYLGAFIPAP